MASNTVLFSLSLLIALLFLGNCQAARHLLETPEVESTIPTIPKLELPPLPFVPTLPKPELPPKPEVPTVPKVELPPLPEIPKVELPPIPFFPKFELPPKPTIPEFPSIPSTTHSAPHATTSP